MANGIGSGIGRQARGVSLTAGCCVLVLVACAPPLWEESERGDPPLGGDAGASGGSGGTVPTGGGAGETGGTAGDPGSGGAGGSGGDAGAGGDAGGSGGIAATGGTGGAAGASGGTGGDSPPPVQPFGCSDVFTQDVISSYQVEISADEWNKLTYEFLHVAENEAAGLDINPYHPIVFRFGSEVHADAMIRLKGQSSWRLAVQLDANPKMQFVISFNEIDDSKKFHGIKKLVLDMPRNDRSYLHSRLANNWLQEAGIPAPCTNSAVLSINGQYYGLYAGLEAFNGSFVKRVFPEAPDGDLWKGGYEPQTNKSSPDWAKLSAFWDVTSIDQMLAGGLVDLESSVVEWAAEVVINQGDGYYGGSHNYELYDYPGRGYRWLPDDVDSTFDWASYTQHPIYWWMTRGSPSEPEVHYRLVIQDPTWRAKYVEGIRTMLARWNPALMQQRLDAWAAQIADAAATDPHRPFTIDQHARALASLRSVFQSRADYLASFIACEDGSNATDADGDGHVWCRECNDANAVIYPGAPELCGDGRDDNCNGLFDEGCP